MTVEPEIPPFSLGAADHVRDRDHLAAVLAAYHRPEATWRGSGQAAHREVRRRGHVQVIVSGGTVIGVVDVEPRPDLLQAESPVIGPPSRCVKRRKRGGAGQRMPTTLKELMKRAEAAGADITLGGRHLRVHRPGCPPTVVAVTPSDWRSIVNAGKQLCRNGIDVARF